MAYHLHTKEREEDRGLTLGAHREIIYQGKSTAFHLYSERSIAKIRDKPHYCRFKETKAVHFVPFSSRML